MHIEYQGFDRRVGAQNTDTPETAGAGRDGGTASSPLSHHLAETGEFPFGSDALYIPSSPAHEPTSSHHAQHPNVKPDEVDEPAGLAAVAEIAALECALAEKERRLRALKGKVATQLADGCSAKGSLPASTAPPLLPAKRKAEEVTLGQPISCGPAAVAVGATTAPHLSHAMVCGAPHAAGSHASVSVPLPLGPATSTAAVVGVPIQQAEALRAQQLQLQATILAQAQGHAEEVATSMGDAAASTCMKHEDDADGSGDSGGDHSLKKQRLVWTTELHNRFINAITHLGLKHAVPKNILTMMNVEGMTRENVASHLQKYRMYLKKIGGYTDKDKVDPDTLQAVHEQNVQQMAAQQALQQSLAVMHGGYGYYGPESPTAEAGAAGSGGLAQQQQAQSQQAQQQQAQQQQAQQQAQQQQQAAVSAAGMPPPGFPMYQPPPQGPWPYGGSPYGGGYPQGFPFGMPPGFPPQPQWQAAAAMQQHAAQQAQQRMVQQAQHHAQQQAAGGKPSVDPNNFGWGWGNPGMAQQAQQLAQQAQQPGGAGLHAASGHALEGSDGNNGHGKACGQAGQHYDAVAGVANS